MSEKVKKILIFRIGSLGDMLIMVPSIWVLKENFPYATLFLLSNSENQSKKVTAEQIFDHSDFFSGYFHYSSRIQGFKSFFNFLKIVFMIRKTKFDLLVYFAPSGRTGWQKKRDSIFFKLVGIKKTIGIKEDFPLPPRQPNSFLPLVEREADRFLLRLKASGLKVPDINCGNPSINLTSEEEKSFQTIISKLPNDFSRPWIACGIASNRSISIWPLERYQKVLTVLIEKYSIWPVILGGVDDFDLGQDLIKRLNCGYNFAGKVSVRLSAIALQRCWLYCGNDTGTMHLAASVGISCIAIFSSAQYPGLWYPYGQGHHIYRTPIECEGCELDDCILKQKQCILSISVAEVLSGCEKILNNLNITSSISKS